MIKPRIIASIFAIASTAIVMDCYSNTDRKAFNSGLRFPHWYGLGMKPLVSRFEPETLHSLSIYITSLPRPIRRLLGLVNEVHPDPVLKTTVFGISFSTPVGLAAGYDKHAEAIDGILDMGFGFTEIGSVTPIPQPGNPKPRLFRLTEDNSVINRYGFNSQGLAAVAIRLKQRNRTVEESGESILGRSIIGVNLGKNKETVEESLDYERGIFALGPEADYIVINISSPNTPGLRDLQKAEKIRNVLTNVITARNRNIINTDAPPTPVLVKIAPDLTLDECAMIANECIHAGIAGVIVSNTTITRPSTLKSVYKDEIGGLSGEALRDLATLKIAQIYAVTNGTLPIIGVGGIFTACDAYEKIRAGASLVQLYSGMVFKGPIIVPEVTDGLTECLKRDGYSSVSQAVGVDASKYINLSQAQQLMKKIQAEKRRN